MVKKNFNFIVSGGEATGGPPIGPAIGPLGVNIMGVVNKINELTASYKGTKVPVEVILDTDTKEFEVKVGMLSTYALVTQALGIQKGSATPNTNSVGNLAFEQLVEIAKKKREDMLAASYKAAINEILGTLVSMGVTVEGKPAKEFQKLIKSGVYDEALSNLS
ncbi:50S ribosomal protein L11 [Candidatus Bathyarchaeota archaeon]|nr:50S ribosomal protein L11 [Candidatus Bathyarchaeota archaeon]MBS7630071.1 50S ribosomal protein L11 [Candidatus Bathyarchaeota archaeon]